MESGRQRAGKIPLNQASSLPMDSSHNCIVYLQLEEVKLTSQSLYLQPPILRKKHLKMKATCECYSFHILSSADWGKKGTIWMGYAPSQHRRTPCLHKQPYMQLNLPASNCANTQLVGTKPASAEDRLLSSPRLCIRRADVSCTVIFWVTAG